MHKRLVDSELLPPGEPATWKYRSLAEKAAETQVGPKEARRTVRWVDPALLIKLAHEPEMIEKLDRMAERGERGLVRTTGPAEHLVEQMPDYANDMERLTNKLLDKKYPMHHISALIGAMSLEVAPVIVQPAAPVIPEQAGPPTLILVHSAPAA